MQSVEVVPVCRKRKRRGEYASNQGEVPALVFPRPD